MTWINYDDVCRQLVDAGLDIGAAIDVGAVSPRRCHEVGGDREKRGWYWLNEITLNNERYIVGSYGVYRGNDSGKTKVTLPKAAPAMTPAQKEAMRTRQAEESRRLKAMRDAEARRAAAEAARVWSAYVPTGHSDYLERKGVGNFGLRYDPGGHGTVAIPMTDGRSIFGLQIIRGKSRGGRLEKQYFPRGMNKAGHYHLIGSPRDVVLIAEGYATGATLHQATGLPVVIAFDANNLRPVAEAIHKTYRQARILVCADDDYLTAGNPGCAAAEAAALAVSGAWCKPTFPGDRAGKKLTDFNDLAHFPEGGEQLVRAQIEYALGLVKWSASAAPRGGSTSGGAGRDGQLVSMVTVDEAVDRFAMIYGAGGTWFDGQEHMLVPKPDLQDILPEHGMRDMRARKRVVRLKEVGFDPACADKQITCNLWAGWPTEPKQGSCEMLLDLLRYLCSGEANSEQVFDWVLKWLAYPIQHPGAKMRTALVFHGPQGVGKNLFFEAVMAIYGEYGRIVDQSAIEDKFNDWASRKLFLIANEVVARNELFHMKNKLKHIVDGEWIRINPKNVAAHDEKNHVNLVFLSNESQPLVLEKDDRRNTVIRVPAKLSKEFYNEVKAELDAGGIAALHHYLVMLDLGDFHEHVDPPMTVAKSDLIDISLDSVERFLRDWIGLDIFFDDSGGPLPCCPCGGGDLYAAYLRWCKPNGITKPRESNQFIGSLRMRPGWFNGHKDRFVDFNNTGITKRQRMVIPSDDDLSAAAKAGGQDYRRQDAENQITWLTKCFFAFRSTMDTRP